MNDIFDIKRFFWLFKKSVLERPALLLGLLAVTLATTLLTYISLQKIGGLGSAQVGAFFLGLLIGGSFLASSVFGYFSSTSSGISYLLLPASHLEKWLCGIIISGGLFVLIYLGFYRVIDVCFVNIYRNNLDPNSPDYLNLYNSAQILSFNSENVRYIFIMFFYISGAMLLGSLYFNKVSFIKVALLIFAFIISTYFINLLFGSFFFNHIESSFPFTNVHLKVGNEVGIINMPSALTKTASFIFTYVIPTILWLLSYLRLKEKEA